MNRSKVKRIGLLLTCALLVVVSVSTAGYIYWVVLQKVKFTDPVL